MLPTTSDRLVYPIGSLSVFIKFIIPVPRNIWYVLHRKITILLTSKLFVKKTKTCTFPGITTPTYSFRNFCYLVLGNSRILILGKKDDERVLFDVRHTFSHTEMRAIVYYPSTKQINYGLYSRDLVIDKLNQLLEELEIKKFNLKIPERANVEIVRVVSPEMTLFYVNRLIRDIETFEIIDGKFAQFQVKVLNVSGNVVIKLISTPVPIDKITPVVDEGKRILIDGLDIRSLINEEKQKQQTEN